MGRRVPLLPPEKRKEAKWRAMMVAEEGDVDAVVVVSAAEVDSVAVEVSVEQVSVEDSVVIGEGSAVAAELGVLEEDLGVEEVDSVEVMTEERAALNSADSFAITSFSSTSSTTSSAEFFLFILQYLARWKFCFYSK